jgi:uncharacterized protein (DUF1800 family)
MRTRIAAFAILFLVAATPSERQRAEHALSRLTFGAKPGDVERVTHIGVDRWIEQQLHPERISDRAIDARVARYTKDVEIPPREEKEMARKAARKAIADVSAQRILRAAESERQLNEVMVDFWMNHFNVFAGKGLDRFLIASYERDAIRPRVWGRFEDLLMATAKSPAMLLYLDNVRSRRGALNENYARELMELHTIGVDAGYTQNDVTELARAPRRDPSRVGRRPKPRCRPRRTPIARRCRSWIPPVARSTPSSTSSRASNARKRAPSRASRTSAIR